MPLHIHLSTSAAFQDESPIMRNIIIQAVADILIMHIYSLGYIIYSLL